MLSRPARAVLDTALRKYRPGRSDLIPVGGIAQLKPALQLMTAYGLMIQDVPSAEVVTSYTRWLECVQVKEDTEPEVYVAFSPRFEQIWLESRKRLPEYMEQKPPNTMLRSQYSLRLYSWAKSMSRREPKQFRWRSSGGFSAWSRSRTRREISLRKRHCRSGRISSSGRLMSLSKRSMRRQT
jgi:hypothetical protein